MSELSSRDDTRPWERASVLYVIECVRGYRIATGLEDGELEYVANSVDFHDLRPHLCDAMALLRGELFMLKCPKIEVVSFPSGAPVRSMLPPRNHVFQGLTAFGSNLYTWTNRVLVLKMEPQALAYCSRVSGQTNADLKRVLVIVRVLLEDVHNNLFEFAYNEASLQAVYRVRCNGSTGEFISQEILYQGSADNWVFPIGVTGDSDFIVRWNRTMKTVFIVLLRYGVEVLHTRMGPNCYRFNSAFLSDGNIFLNYLTGRQHGVITRYSIEQNTMQISDYGPGEDFTNVSPFNVVTE